MLRQIRRFECQLSGTSGLEAANEFLRQLHSAGARAVDVLAVPGPRGTEADSDSIYIVFEPADEPDMLAATATAEVAVEILDPEDVADTLGNGHTLPSTPEP